MGAESRYGILIDAKANTANAFSQATQDVKRLGDELKHLQQNLNGNAAANLKYADTFVAFNRAKQNLRDIQAELLGTAKAAEKLQDTRAMEGLVQGLAAKAGPLGTLANSLSTVNIGAALAVASIGALGTGVILAAKSIGEFQERMDNLSAMTGLTTHELGGLSLSAANVGKSFEQISPSLDIFIRHLDEARRVNGEVRKSFKDLGVTNLDASTGQILEEIGKGLEGIEDPARRAALAFAAFGRNWRQIFPVITQDMKENSQVAQEWGISLSASAEAAARKADVAFDRLGARWHGFTTQMKADSAANGTTFAVWAEGVIDWLGKVQQKMHEKYEINFALKHGGVPALEGNLRDFFQHFGETEKPPVNTAAGALTEEQQKQLKALDAHIAGMERLRAAGKLLLDDEILQLSKLEDQAIAMEDQVVGASELLKIRKESAKLMDVPEQGFTPSFSEKPRIQNADGSFSTERTITIGSDGKFFNIPTIVGGIQKTSEEAIRLFVSGLNDAVGVFKTETEALAAARTRTEEIGRAGGNFVSTRDTSLTTTPSLKSELMTPQAFGGGIIDIGKWFKDSKATADKGQKEFEAAMEQVAASFDLAGEAGKEFNHLLKTHEEELADAYAQGNKELEKRIGALAKEAKAHVILSGAMDAALQTLAGGVTDLFAALFQSGGGSFWDKLGDFFFGKNGLDATFVKHLVVGAVGGLQTGGQYIGAQGGLALTGVRGRDTIDVKMGKGEGIFDHSIMDDMRQFLRSPGSYAASRGDSGQTSSGDTYHITVPVTIKGLLIDRMAIRDLTAEHILPAMRELVPKGIFRAG